ncbi:hypothetical protein ABXS75_12460 [Roseburia hominis]
MGKKLVSIIMCIMLGAALVGCGSDKGSKDSSKENDTAEIDKDFSIEMTDSFTYKDPEDLDFNQRYVLVGDESCKLLSDMKGFGYTATKVYDIMYGKDGKPVAEYNYFIAPDETSAADLAEFYSSQGQNVMQEGTIVYAVSEGDTVEAAIAAFAAGGTLSEETLEAYVEMMKSYNGLTEY